MCSACGALSLPVDVCLECGGETTAIPDVFESLSRSVVDGGGSVEHVMADTRLAGDLVAAKLRFEAW
jgi:hypothetical protein